MSLISSQVSGSSSGGAFDPRGLLNPGKLVGATTDTGAKVS